MKSLVFLFICAVAISFAACGNSTKVANKADSTIVDSDSVVADSMVADSVDTVAK